MRIISGELGGRLFDSPHTHRTHPMSDKVRGALFSILGDIEDLTVLDAFGGTGALAFEAISRGAQNVVVVENDRVAQEAIAKNIQNLGLEGRAQLIKANVNSWFAQNPDIRFDVILCDPPYDDLQQNALQSLAHLLRQDGIFIVSWPGAEPPLEVPGLALLEHRSYGDAELLFYRR